MFRTETAELVSCANHHVLNLNHGKLLQNVKIIKSSHYSWCCKFELGAIVQSAQTGGGDNAANDRDMGDLTEIRYIEWCNLNKMRLGMIIAGQYSHDDIDE